MKTNDYLLMSGTLAYSYLFFEQNAGINFLVFDIVFIALLIIRNRQLLQNKKWLFSSLLCLMAGTGILLHSSNLAVFANVISLLVLSGVSYGVQTFTIFSFAFSCYSVASSGIYVVIDAIKRNENRVENSKVKQGYRIYTIIVVTLLALLFLFLYRSANPLFAKNTEWINLDFISWSWLVFTLVGFLLVYGLFWHRPVAVVEEWEGKLKNKPIPPLKDSPLRFEYERLAGVLLFGLLNLMLLLLNSGDIHTIWLNGSLPKGITHSDFVHNGVAVVILSILFATGLILHLFRSDFEKVKYSGLLNALVIAWIVQNLVMLYSTACRNNMYIHQYDLTYKRIGVYVWLGLAAIGLAILLVQVWRRKSSWFLIKTNFAAWQVALSLCALVNWDLVVTHYNLNNKALKDIDLYYLARLSDSNIPEMITVLRTDEFKAIQKNEAPAYEKYYDDPYQKRVREALAKKIKAYLLRRNNSWQSWSFHDARIDEALKGIAPAE